MLQNLLFLRPSIEGVSVTTENIAFKVLYAISTPLFLAFGVIFYTRVCFTDPINCITNSSESFKVLKAVDSYCLENSYVDLLGSKGEVEVQITYQYVGLFFAVIGCLAYVPYILWEWCENGTLKALLQDLSSITLEEGDKMQSQIRKLTLVLKKNPDLVHTYAIASIASEICNCLVLFGIFGLGDSFLGGGYFTTFETNSKVFFPKVTKCSFDTGHVVYEGVCTMNLNYLSEKLFFFAWWWLVGCLTLSLSNLTYRWALVSSAEFRSCIITMGLVQTIWAINPSKNDDSTKSEEKCNLLAKYVPYFGGINYGQAFMLKRIQANVPPFTFCKILEDLTKGKYDGTEAVSQE